MSSKTELIVALQGASSSPVPVSIQESISSLSGDIAVVDERLPSVPFPVRTGRSTEIILPRWIYIRDRQGRYLTVRTQFGASLTFRSGAPDLDCAFETIRNWPSWFMLLTRNGNHIMRHFNSLERWYSADSANEVPTFHFIPARGDIVYLQDNYVPHNFMSNELLHSGAVLARNFINQNSELEIVIAAVRNEIINVQYNIPGAVVRAAPPLIVLSTTVRNDSNGDVTQTLDYTYEKWSVGTWNNSAGTEIGSRTTFSAGVPFISSAEFELSVSTSNTREWGGEEGVREIVTSSTTVTVPPRKRARATIVVRNAQLDVEFTYTQRILWSNGQSQETSLTGIYTNVDSWHVDVVVDAWEDI